MITWEAIKGFLILIAVLYPFVSIYSKVSTILRLKIKEARRREILIVEMDELVEEQNELSEKYRDLYASKKLYLDLHNDEKVAEIDKELADLTNQYQVAQSQFNTTKSQVI